MCAGMEIIMSNDNIRIGRVSSIDYDNGMVSVVYKDRDNSITKKLPYLNLNGEYKMPDIDDMVLVAHLSNGTAAGIVLGTFWNKNNQPLETGRGLYRKELSKTAGEAYFKYDSDTKILTIKADSVKIETNDNTVTY
jgi:phage baseplate assembly protein gpV